MSDTNEPIEVTEEGDVVIRNAEQREIMLSLLQLQDDCNRVLGMAERDRHENESLARESASVDWHALSCTDSRRFISVDGGLGWIVTVEGADPTCKRLCAYVADHLRSHGWEGVEVLSTW